MFLPLLNCILPLLLLYCSRSLTLSIPYTYFLRESDANVMSNSSATEHRIEGNADGSSFVAEEGGWDYSVELCCC